MDVSIFLAKVIGWYLIIIGLAYFLRKNFILLVVKDFYQSPAVIVLSAIINLMIGLLIVLNHSIWELSWKGAITVIGCLSLTKGIIHLFLPDLGKKLSEVFFKWDIFVVSGLVCLAFGFYLLYFGYAKFMESFFI